MTRKNRWFAFIFIFVGFSMLALWTMLVLTMQVPEFADEPFTTITHITAESLTGLALIISGIGMLRQAKWAALLSPVATGMLFYAVVQAIGYYIDHSSPFFVGMFIVLILFCVLFFRKKLKEQN